MKYPLKNLIYRTTTYDLENPAKLRIGGIYDVKYSYLRSDGIKRISLDEFKVMILKEYKRYFLVRVLGGLEEYDIAINKCDILLGDYEFTLAH